MKKTFLFLILLLILFSIIGMTCEKQPTLNCEQACKYEGYKEGECKKVPVIEDPCSAVKEITLFDFECNQKVQEKIVGVDYYCCCKE